MTNHPPVTNLASGLRALVNRPFLLTGTYRDQQLRANRTGAAPELIAFERRFVGVMAQKHGVPMFAHSMVRTVEEQDALYDQGVSKAKGVYAAHPSGCAVDIIHSVLPWDLDEKSWAMIGHIGKEIALRMGVKLVWGGDWSFYDPAHWELAYWRDVRHGFPFRAADNARKLVSGRV